MTEREQSQRAAGAIQTWALRIAIAVMIGVLVGYFCLLISIMDLSSANEPKFDRRVSAIGAASVRAIEFRMRPHFLVVQAHAMADPEWTLDEELELIQRGYELRKARKIGIILADRGRIYMCESEGDPWGTKRRVSWERFRELIEAAEAAAG